MPLTSVNDFCTFLQKLIQVHHTYLNKHLRHSIIIPYHYIGALIAEMGFPAFQAETDAWWTTNKGNLTNIAFINFGGGSEAMVVEVTFKSEGPLVTWNFNLEDQFVKRLIAEHVAICPAKLDVRIPRSLVGKVNTSEVLDHTLAAHKTLRDPVISLSRDYLTITD